MKHLACVCVILFCVREIGSHSLNNPSITQLTDPVNIGESPVWDPRVGKLFFVDIHHGRVLAYDFEKQKICIAAEFPGNDITPIVLTKNPNVMIAGMNRTLARISLYSNSSKPEILHTVHQEHPKNRFNDGKADSKGRLWIGSIGHEPPNGTLETHVASLFKFTKDIISDPEVVIPKVSISNGITWSLDGNLLYYIDTHSEEIVQYDFDGISGSISNKKVVFSTKGKRMGYPDGMTIDADGNLWVALYAGGSVIQINPSSGTLLRRVPIPAQYTTSVAWGGPDLDVLFVTTAKRWLNEKELAGQPGAGSLYAVTNLGTKGVLDFQVDF